MPETKTAVEKSSGLNQAMIDAIERRLSLRGGTTLREMCADLVERFGDSGQALRDKTSELYSLDSRTKLTDEERRVVREKLTGEVNALKGKRDEKIVGYRGLILKYLEKSYGEPILNEQTKGTIGYGDRIEVEKGHYKKTW